MTATPSALFAPSVQYSRSRCAGFRTTLAATAAVARRVVGLVCVLGLLVQSRGESEGNFTYAINEGGASVTITAYSGPSTGSLAIPDSLGGLPVTGIGNSAFQGKSSLTGALVLPNGVTTIGEWAFGDCSGFTRLALNNGLRTIGESAFSGCSGFTGILTIPDSVSFVGGFAFSSCMGFTGTLVIPIGVSSIEEFTFFECIGFTSLTLPKTLTSIGWQAFANCNSLTAAGFLGIAPTVGMWAFTGATPGFTVYYQQGATGFTSPMWNDYPSKVAVAPTFSTQPSDQVVTSGGTASFTVVVTGDPVPTIQWRKDGIDIAGATGSLLQLVAVQASDRGSYEAIAANPMGSITSDSAQLTVDSPSPPVIIEQSRAVGGGFGQDVALNVTATGATGYQWYRNGRPIVSGTGPSLPIPMLAPGDAGIYDCTLTGPGGNTLSAPIVVGVVLDTAPATGSTPPPTAGSVTTKDEWQNIQHPNGNTYDQFLLGGISGTFSANPGQIARMSFLDLNDSIIQVEMSGSGAITVALDEATVSGPLSPVLYNQTGIEYMKGKATIILAGADQTTHFTIYSVGTATNPGVTFPSAAYDGWADVAVAGAVSTDGKLGGIHQGNVDFNSDLGYTGFYAPNVGAVGGLVVIHGITASNKALPYLHFAPGGNVRVKIAGSSLFQESGDPITAAGLAEVQMGAGQDSCGRDAPAQTNQARLLNPEGNDITATVVAGP